MAKEKVLFKEFLSAVAPEHQAFVEELNNKLIEQGCDLVIKEVKSGYAASYQLEKKTIMNWVFRKSGVLARIYGDNAGKYEDTLASLPADMQKKMTASRDCKRLIDPNACSDTCVKGFVYSWAGLCRSYRTQVGFIATGRLSPITPSLSRRQSKEG